MRLDRKEKEEKEEKERKKKERNPYHTPAPPPRCKNTTPMILAAGRWIHARELCQRRRTRAHQDRHDRWAIDQGCGPALRDCERKGCSESGPAVGNDPACGYGFEAGHFAGRVSAEGEVGENGVDGDGVGLDSVGVEDWFCWGG